MKKQFAALVLAGTALTFPAASADYFTPLTSQTSIFNWTGAYIGIGGGTGITNANTNLPGAASATILDGSGDRGYFGKLTLGYDHMFANGVILGASVAGRYGDIDSSWSNTGLTSGSIEADYGIDVVARLGYAITPRTMAYVLAGYSWQHFTYTGAGPAASADWNDNGYVVGIGTETAFRNNWTWASEYRYANYSGVNIAANAGNIDPAIHSFHSSLNYRFGGGPSGITRAPVAYDWSGLKFGGALGLNVAINEGSSAVTSFNSFTGEGFLGELNIGYDHQFHEKWLAGVVLAGRYANASSSATFVTTTGTVEDDGFGFDALLRVGRKVNDYTLGYIIGGYSWQKAQATIATGGVVTATANPGLNGFTIGSGTELALSERTTAFVEYRYSAYEDFSVGALNIDPSGHSVRVGAKFKLY